MGVRGIRPLYTVQVLIFVGIFILLLARLSSSHTSDTSGDGRRILSGFAQVLKQDPDVVCLGSYLIGIVSLFRGLLSIPAPLLGGLIWEHIGPQHVFFAAIAIDAFLRLPLLASVRETLHLPSAS